MSVAYLVLAHRAPGQVARLIDRLCDEEDHVFLHVDRRVDVAPFAAALAAVPARDRIRFARRRFRSRWAAFALLDATLALLEQAVEESLFTHICLLSGDSYPLVPAAVRTQFLARAGERSFVSSSDGTDIIRPDRSANERWFWSGDLRRVTFRHYQLGDHQVHLPNRFLPQVPRLAPPEGMRLLQGSQWWTLSRRAARHVVETFIRRPELRRYFRRVQAPDEWAIQMVLGNSELAETIVNEDLHFIRWAGWHAETLEPADLPRITDSAKLFARKLSPFEPALADRLDDLMAMRAREGGAALNRLSAHHLAA